jgi:hypothetical protein
MPRRHILYTLILSLPVLLIHAPVGAQPRAVDLIAGGKTPPSPVTDAKPAELNDRARETKVIVNGVTVPNDKISSLERAYRVPIRPGAYWYDKISGLWGVEGGPLMGQIVPNLDLGGPLKAKASRGATGVFINGRELPLQEVMFLRQLGPVLPGRYWLDARGIAGFEGGPPQFDLGGAIAAQQKNKGGGMYGGWNRTTPGGHLGGDDNCSYFLDPSTGSSVMNCK